MKKIIISLPLLVCAAAVFSQEARFVTTGVIEYEKRVNMFAVLKKNITSVNQLFMQEELVKYQRENPQFKTFNSTLSFSENKTLLVPEAPRQEPYTDLPMVAQNNVVYHDLSANLQVSQKKVFGEIFLLTDSASKIRWKITDEVRDIAGYSCRRANGLILDSIYVVAFYAIEIPVSGGPESFTGLPGMILQVTMPHENITWVAKRVLDRAVPASGINPPQAGKPTNRQNLYNLLSGASKDWGENRDAILKSFLL